MTMSGINLTTLIKMLNITFITGPVGCGKSTLGEVIVELAKRWREVLWIDSNRCIKNSRRYGKETKVVKSVLENLQWLQKDLTTIINILIPGCPRSYEEIIEWNLAVEQGIVSYRTVFVECNEDEIAAGVNDCILKGFIRPDDGPQELAARLAEYKEKTLPMVEKLPQVTRTSRSKTFTERVRDVVNTMDIPTDTRDTWIRRLDTETHPIHRTIRLIEGVEEPLPGKAPIRISRIRSWRFTSQALVGAGEHTVSMLESAFNLQRPSSM